MSKGKGEAINLSQNHIWIIKGNLHIVILSMMHPYLQNTKFVRLEQKSKMNANDDDDIY